MRNPVSGFEVDGIEWQVARSGCDPVEETRVPDSRHSTELIVNGVSWRRKMRTLEFQITDQIGSRLFNDITALEEKDLHS